MKHLILSLFLLGSLFSGYAQNDTMNKTPAMRDTTPVTNNSTTNNNIMATDSTGSVNNSIQNDSTAAMNTMKTDSTGSVNNSMQNDSTAIMNTMKTDSTGSVNNSMQNDSTATMNAMKTDSTGSVNNSPVSQSNMNSYRNDSTQMNSSANTNSQNPSSGMITNSQNVQGQPGYASLPLLESYVPADVVSKIKSKYPTVYDITAVKHGADQTAYAIRHLDNGVYQTEIIGEAGNTVQ